MTAPTIDAFPAVMARSIPRPVAEPLLAGVVTAALTAAGAWIPSTSGDESATASAISRSFPDLVRMTTGTVDAVHGLYYVVLQLWVHLFASHPSRCGRSVRSAWVRALLRQWSSLADSEVGASFPRSPSST